MKVVVVLFLLLNSCLATRLLSSDEIQKLFINFTNNKATEHDLSMLKDVLEIYKPAYLATQKQYERSSRESINCLVCRSAFGALISMVHQGAEDAKLISAVSTLCSYLGIVSPRACRGLIELNIPILTHIIKTTPEAEASTFCGLVLQRSYPNFCVYNDKRFEWTVDLPERADLTQLKVSGIKSTPLTIAIIAEAHIDPLYEPNGVADCNEPTCCRKGQTPRTETFDYYLEESIMKDSIIKTNDDIVLNLDNANEIRNKAKIKSEDKAYSPPAGFWGDYRNCDTPLWAFDDVIERIASTHKNVDVVYYMGDNIDHHVWETTYEMIEEVNDNIINKMRKEFGDSVLVVHSIGNHESQPTNQFAPSTVKGDKINTTWLYEGLAKKWDFYLTDEARASVREKGAFSILVRPGLRVISMNNNVAFKSNWWLVYDPLDSKRHLDWLVNELYKAELAGEKVHILGHIPPGVHDFIYTWTREYNRIVSRFSSTIAAEFTGHTHSDEFKIFYSVEDGSPISVAWGAGSATAYTYFNLNYKIATIDPTTFEPLNMENYIYNLTEANLTPDRPPRWFQLYDIKNSFGLEDLSAKSMDKLVYRMVTENRSLLDLYSAFFPKLSDYRWPHCNDYCKINNLCKTVITVLWEREKCNELRRLFFS